MEVDVNKRLTAIDALQHKWINKKVPNPVFDEANVEIARETLSNLTNFRVSDI